MQISIIIPALDEARRITTAISRAWEAGASEVIVVDGGSRDGTRELVADARCQLVDSPPGRARQQNSGAARAAGDVLLFQHADTWLSSGCGDQIRAAFGAPLVLGGAFRQRIEDAGIGYRWLERGNAWRARLLGVPYGDQGIFMRRSVFEQLGGFPDVPLMEDLILMKRFRRLSRPALLPGPIYVAARRWQRNGLVRQTLRNWTLASAYHLGVDPHRLAQWYPRHQPDPTEVRGVEDSAMGLSHRDVD